MDVAPSSGRPIWLYYKAFGLSIRSCFALPELLEADNLDFDVEIQFGAVKLTLPQADDAGLRYFAAPGKLLLIVDGVARFLVLEGDKIVVERIPGASQSDIRPFLLGPALGGLMQQREDLLFRGSVIEREGKAIAFLGPSGSGKSTLAMAFHQRGYRFVADEHCVVRPDGVGTRLIQAGSPHISLWPDSLRKLSFAVEDLPRVRRKLQKRVVSLKEGFNSSPLPIGRIYLLRPGLTNRVELNPLSANAAYAALENRAQFSLVLDGLGLAPSYRQMMMVVTMHTPVKAVHRPRRKFNLEDMVSVIEADFSL